MARIWRKGQKKTVHIYRFLSTGTIDERIYLRQLSKLGMKGSILKDIITDSNISAQDLRDIFTFDEKTDCLTHQLSECACLSGKENHDDWTHLPLNSDSFNRWNGIDDGMTADLYRMISNFASFAYVKTFCPKYL
jgi:DNA repair and recombination protein RAD54B